MRNHLRRGATGVLATIACLFVSTELTAQAPDKNVISNSINMKLVEIPAGEFEMGAEADIEETLRKFPDCDRTWMMAELPRHKVKITKPFYMGQYEVTLNQFLKFYHDSKYKIDAEIDGNPSWGFDKEGNLIESLRFRPWDPIAWKIELNHPVIYVTWDDAVAFCDWLTAKEGHLYRLPTEAEWEYACRAGTSSQYSFGDNPEELVKHANSADNSRLKFFYPGTTDADVRSRFVSGDDKFVWTAPIGRFQPNNFGLYDMHGNGWEWCSDYFEQNYYEDSPTEDPLGPVEGETHVLRGGGFYDGPFHLRCARRHSELPSGRDYGSSFRVVREK
ncbi:formylglycine-generating enzyme family protein [Schlesneria sp. DSM 10557]|uniref:formylglycine-generating enzyme family protein n=1 Tax=Schlesneria sp. DSM 10557 TaxID=3044399 RepID=UPI00359F1A4D